MWTEKFRKGKLWPPVKVTVHSGASKLTVMVDGVDEADPYVRVVVGHQHDVEQLLTLRVQLAQAGVDGLQSLNENTATGTKVRPTAAQWAKINEHILSSQWGSTLTRGNAGPGAKGSFSCWIW